MILYKKENNSIKIIKFLNRIIFKNITSIKNITIIKLKYIKDIFLYNLEEKKSLNLIYFIIILLINSIVRYLLNNF